MNHHKPAFTLDQLLTFTRVVDGGSFSAAGRSLGRVQSAVSYAIAQLEAALGAELFERGGRTPVATPAGERLLAEARVVLAQAQLLEDCASRLQAGEEGTLRVMVDALYPQAALVRVCAGLRAAFPQTLARLETGLLGDVFSAVIDERADVGICNLADRVDAKLHATYLGSVTLVPVCSAHHPLASAPAPHSAAVLERSVQIVHAEREHGDGIDHGVISERTWRVTDLALKADLIRQGVGWGSVPLDVAAPELASGTLVRLHPDAWAPEGHRLPLHAIARASASEGRAAAWLRDALVFAPPVC